MKNIWNIEKCISEAKKYTSISDIRILNPSLYAAINKRKLQSEIYKFLPRTGTTKKRCIYVYEFKNKYVYVGLTYNIIIRHRQHLSKTDSSVYQHYIKTKETPKYKILTKYIDIDKARELEKFYLDEYKKNDWNILNKIKAGSTGGNTIIWTKEACKLVVEKYCTKKDLRKNESSCYVTMKNNKWLDELCVNYKELRKQNNSLTYEYCKNIALKYKTIKDLINNDTSVYTKIKRNKWGIKLYSHMEIKKRPFDSYTYDYCKSITSQFKTVKDLRCNKKNIYEIIKKRGWYDLLDSLKRKNKPIGYWNDYNRCKSESEKYPILRDFHDKNRTAYEYSRKNNWLHEFYPNKRS